VTAARPSPARARRRGRAALAVLGVLGVLAAPAALGAQIESVRGADRVRNVAANAVLSAGTAGVRALVARRPLTRALLLGAIGGAAQAGGKQVAGRGFAGSGVLGRALSTGGLSLAVSASGPRTALELPVGPVLIALTRDTVARDGVAGADTLVGGATPAPRWRSSWRVNLWSVAMLGLELGRGGVVDLPTTLGAGAIVVQRRAGDVRTAGDDGRVVAGTAHQHLIVIAPALSPASRREVLAHEAIHVLQFDQAGLLAAYPLERALLAQVARAPLPRGLRERVLPHVDLGVVLPLTMASVGGAVAYDNRPWEREARLLTAGEAGPP
jgi:hypothetical protein